MSIVKSIVTESRIGQAKDGFWVNVVEVQYADGATGTFYRLHRGDGRIYGLQSHKPALVECCQASLDDCIDSLLFAQVAR